MHAMQCNACHSATEAVVTDMSVSMLSVSLYTHMPTYMGRWVRNFISMYMIRSTGGKHTRGKGMLNYLSI